MTDNKLIAITHLIGTKNLTMKSKISAIIITYNESGNLDRTLTQLHWCDEIIVVDSFSSDDTVEICEHHGCKIYSRSFTGFGDQKRFAIGKAKNNWILCIDADEYMTDQLVNELQFALCDPGDCKGYMIPMNLVFRGQEFKYGREHHNYFLRVFHRKYCIVHNQKVHEGFEVLGKVKKLNNCIKHFSYRDIKQILQKLDIYSTLGAELNIDHGRKRSQLLIYIALPFYFFKYFFIDRNFLNGRNGFYWAVYSAFYHFTKYIKMQDINRERIADNVVTDANVTFQPINFLNPTIYRGKN